MKQYKLKRLLTLTFAVHMIFTASLGITSFAKDDSGRIDFYKAFSKSEENIDMIGNRIYNWSIYLPSDAVIDKNPKATTFNMNSSSFKTNVSINVYKNIHNLSLEQIYAASVSKNSYDYYDYYSYDYKCSANIQTNKQGNRYILLTSIAPEYSSFGTSTSDAEEEKGTYNEERTYLGKSNDINYIYKMNISTDLPFFKQHKNLFNKLADSFKTTFDSKNPNIKDLSDLATSYRPFESKIYGWKIELAPYWKLQNQETSTTVSFKPLYSTEEIGLNSDSAAPSENTEGTGSIEVSTGADKNNTEQASENRQNQISDSGEESAASNNDSDTSEQESDGIPSEGQIPGDEEKLSNSKVEKITDFLSVSFVSSVPANETFSEWVEKEFDAIRSGYNKSLFSEYGVSPDSIGHDANKKLIMYKIKNSSRDTFTEGIMLAEGNGYRYRIMLRMKDSKFSGGTGRESFYRMLRSFTLIDKKSSFVNEVIPAEAILNPNSPKTISLKNFNIKIDADNNWIEPFDIYEGQLEDYSYGYDSEYYPQEEDTSTEQLNVNHPASSTSLSLNAGITDQSDDDWKKAFTDSQCPPEDPALNREAWSANYKNIPVYKLIEKYDIREMEVQSAGDKRKFYNYKTLEDTYTYIFKSGGEEYRLVFTIPVINTSEETEKMVEELWKKVIVNKVNLGAEVKDWSPLPLNP